MSKFMALKPMFVEMMPNQKEQGVLYISDTYKVAIHLCACGCGFATVTPFGNTGNVWQLTRNGDSITLDPSIGNMQFPCKSHYFIKSNVVEWC